MNKMPTVHSSEYLCGKEKTGLSFSVKFVNYCENDYDAVCDFLIEMNRNNDLHINWNWARFEWMYEHSGFDKSLISNIGLWKCSGHIVGAAIYDMYFGEAFCGAVQEFEYLYPEILKYASEKLCDDSGIAVAVCDDNQTEIEAIKKAGFTASDQHETIMMTDLDRNFKVELPEGLTLTEFDPSLNAYNFQWLLWQGFDHGQDKCEFKSCEKIIPQKRKHIDPYLSIAAVNDNGDIASYCCLWYDKRSDYAYIEPVCTIPSYRGNGLAKAVISEALNRVKMLGARRAFVISDMSFYSKLGFQKYLRFTFFGRSFAENT